MRSRADKSPLALTAEMAAALRAITLTPLLDAAGISRECGEASTTLEQLVSRGLVKTQASRKRDGRASSLYCVTLKGMQALDRHTPAPRRTAPAPLPYVGKGYTCPELGRTCQRPGAYDAFSLPSLFGNERRLPRGVA